MTVAEDVRDEWLSTPKAAELLGVRVRTVYNLINKGELPADFVLPYPGPKSRRRAIRIRRQDLEDFIEQARVKPGQLRHLHPAWEWDRYHDGTRYPT